MYKLIIEDDEGHTTVVPLVKDEITIGRKDGNTIRLTERNVSRRHARLTRSNGSVFIEDLDSYNGVKVNGDRITARTSIREGDLVEIGDYHLAIQQAVEEESPPPIPPPVPEAGPPPLPEPVSAEREELPAEEEVQPAGEPAAAAPPAEEQAPVGEIPEQDAGRLVVVSTELAGTGFPLVRTEMVVGRTEDNDIVIPHRSVSSRHAKVVFDGGIYRILDLDSANGVMVNGEEYARVDLRRGDVVELGHVKLRYVAPGEEYVFSTEESYPEGKRTMVDAAVAESKLAVSGGKRWGRLVVLLVLLAGAGIAALLIIRQQGSTQADGGLRPEIGSDAGAAEASSETQELFDAAMTQYNHRNFAAAAAGFKGVLAGSPNHKEAKEMIEKAQAEQKNAQLKGQVDEAIGKSDWDKALKLVDQIPEESVFFAELTQLKGMIRNKSCTTHQARARTAFNAGQIDRAKRHLEAALTVEDCSFPTDLKQSIEKASQSRPTPPTREKETPRRSPGPSRQQRAAEAKDLTQQGLRLIKEGKHNEAIGYLKKAIQLDSSQCPPYKYLGIVYATIGDQRQAANYYQKFLDVCPNDPKAPDVRNILNSWHESR